MKRRDVLKGISLSALGLAGLNPQVKAAELADEAYNKDPEFKQFGRTEYEQKRDAKLFAEQFFSPQEMKIISVLVDIIIPRDGRSGSATEAGVPEFIEFMVKDKPDFQTPLRGGLGWIDNEAHKRFDKAFIDITPAQRIEIVEDIAYPENKKPGMRHGIVFFSLIRNLTASGFWSSKIGIADIGYQGNTPNSWDGVPGDVLKQYGLE
jgi:hypothetical protein